MFRGVGMRVHVTLPKEMVEEVDRLVGPRRRSEFIVEAVRQQLARRKRSEMGRRVAGSLAEVDVPGWESSESAAEWVRVNRRNADAILHYVPAESTADA